MKPRRQAGRFVKGIGPFSQPLEISFFLFVSEGKDKNVGQDEPSEGCQEAPLGKDIEVCHWNLKKHSIGKTKLMTCRPYLFKDRPSTLDCAKSRKTEVFVQDFDLGESNLPQ